MKKGKAGEKKAAAVPVAPAAVAVAVAIPVAAGIPERFPGIKYVRLRSAGCPACKCADTRILNTRPWENGLRLRYHGCRRCGARFKSTEEKN